MKYTKPATLNSVVLLNFLDSLPAEFEIVEPGMTQVRWPECATKEKITWHADNQRGRGLIADSLYALAAIAPEEKKKRKGKWIAWHKDTWLPGTTPILQHEDSSFPYSELGWRKVGECEVDT